MEQVDVFVETQERLGALEWWRHALSHGGINRLPLPERVVEGLAKLKPRLIRIFVQEHFNVYPERGRFDWSLMDPFMDALAGTGAKVVAAITIKPKVLYPKVDHSIWRPTDWSEWQRVIREMVKRYSVDRQIVSHWEIGNETDIGENGGSPYLIPDPKKYLEYYTNTIKAVLDAWPAAKVGGPAACWVDNEPLPGLVKLCRETKTQLDFISWHLYSDDASRHALGVEKGKELLRDWPGPRPEMFVTEWSKSFDKLSYEDLAFDPRRAAIIAACALAMTEAGVDWSFYYHVWDQTFYSEPFRPFFSEAGIHMMETHWNKVPHRFGFFGVGEEVRPHYFVYQMLSRLGDERVSAKVEGDGLRVLAARGDGHVAVMVVNEGASALKYRSTEQEASYQSNKNDVIPSTSLGAGLRYAQDDRYGGRVVTTHFSRLKHGRKMLTVYRIDEGQRWDAGTLELAPVEKREVWTSDEFHCQVYLPGDSVGMVKLEEVG
jgi:hypothetical protein